MNLERIRYVNTNRKSQVTDRTDLRERRNVGVLNVCVCLFSAGFYAKWLNVMRSIIIWWMFVWDSGHSDLHTHIRWFLSLKVTGPCGPEVVVCYNVCVCVCVCGRDVLVTVTNVRKSLLKASRWIRTLSFPLFSWLKHKLPVFVAEGQEVGQ